MCSYYNPSNRGEQAAHDPFGHETFSDADRDAMVSIIPYLRAPVIHYKIFAAGRKDPKEAFEFVARHLRPQDAVCVGVFTKDNLNMLAEDVRLLESALSG
jgi:hypothetical protein